MYEGESLSLDTLLPPDARLKNPDRDEDRIKPHYDQRGILDIEKLIADINASVDATYEWPPGLNVHHFYWPEAEYEYRRNGSLFDNPYLFRNLPIHKGLVPKTFHAWLHIISDPPDIPDQQVMQNQNEAWAVARDLFKMARETIVTQKQAKRRRIYVAQNPHVIKPEFNGHDIIGEEIMQEVLERNFMGFLRQVGRQEKIPKEHRLIDLEGSPAEIAKELGRLVVPPSLNLVGRIAA